MDCPMLVRPGLELFAKGQRWQICHLPETPVSVCFTTRARHPLLETDPCWQNVGVRSVIANEVAEHPLAGRILSTAS